MLAPSAMAIKTAFCWASVSLAMLPQCGAPRLSWLPPIAARASKEARGLIGYDPVAMPRYFFVVTYADHQIDDPDGTLLPADTAAIEYARRIINDLREERRPEEPEPSIAVKNAAGEVIYRFPSN